MEPLWIYALGFFSQLLFGARMLIQWLLSEKARRIENPTIFWFLGLSASLLFMLYGWLRHDFALILGQFISYYVYIWNLGAKGFWQKLGRWRVLLLPVLLLIPLAAVSPIFIQETGVPDILLHNKDIPQGLLVFGSAGQIVVSTRFLYQAVYSIRRNESLLPVGFWIISLVGATMILIYGILRRDPVVIVAESFGLITYSRNLMLWYHSRKNS